MEPLQAENDKKPNVIWLTTDHHLFYGHDGIQRPNYEKFCKEAVEFTRAYTVCPLCSPARRSMLDGLYPHNHGVLDNDINLPLDEETYYNSLLQNNYDCRYIGKWHAGCNHIVDGKNIKGLTTESYGCPYTWDDYKDYLRQKGLNGPQAYIDISFSQKDFYREGTTLDLTKVKHLFSQSFGRMVSDKETHELFYLGNRAVETMRELSVNSKPFCLRVDFWGPHHPYFPSEEFLKMYDPEKISMYPSFCDDLSNKPDVYRNDHAAGMIKNGKLIYPNPLPTETWKRMLWYAYAHVSMADAAIGLILDEAEKMGLIENTVIIVTSDHGDALGCHGGHMDKDTYLCEEVLRIPLAVMYKEKLEPQKLDCLVSNLDIPVTVANLGAANLAGANPEGAGFKSQTDGIDLIKLADNCRKDCSTPRDFFVSVTHGHFTKNEGRALICGQYKYVYNHHDAEELYDLSQDKYEMNNLAKDINYNKLLGEMRQKLNEWQRRYQDPLVIETPPNRV